MNYLQEKHRKNRHTARTHRVMCDGRKRTSARELASKQETATASDGDGGGDGDGGSGSQNNKRYCLLAIRRPPYARVPHTHTQIASKMRKQHTI